MSSPSSPTQTPSTGATNRPLLTIYKASAGSGKTFTLAAEYISLLLRKPDDFRHILAVTFTNKATAEMKERILSQLYGIAKGLPESEGYLNKVKELLEKGGYTEDVNHNALTDDVLRANAQKALDYILHNYSFFRIETIDSFMVGILRNLAKELELGNDMTIELDERKVIDEGIHDLIKELNIHSPELNWIVEYIGSSIEDERKWNITGDLASFAGNLHKEGWQNHATDIKHQLSDFPDTISKLRNSMNAQAQQAKDATQAIVEEFDALVIHHGFGVNDFNGKSHSPFTFFEKLKQGQAPNITDTLQQYADGRKKWANSNAPSRAAMEDCTPTLCDILNRAITALQQQIHTVNTATLVTRNLYQLQLLGSIDNQISDNCRRDNRFLLADTCVLLRQMASDPTETSFIYEKTGTEINHILIDEFQDTSGMQWANFLPLMIENMSRGQHNLIVGDVKQAIYRWRDSDARIMGSKVEEALSDFHPDPLPLRINRRSRAGIVRFNNDFFRHLIDDIKEKNADIDPTDIVNYYEDVEQELKDPNDQEGCVRIITTSAATDDDGMQVEETDDEQMCRHTVAQIVELLDAGLEQRDIAILTRRNSDITKVADYVASHPDATAGYNLRIVSGEAYTLESSDIIALLIEALHWVADATDIVSLAALGISYHRLVMNDGKDVPSIMALQGAGYGLPKAFLDSHDELAAMPLGELMYALYDRLELNALKGRDAWLQSFFDTVRRYAADENGSLSDFLKAWDERLAKKAIPSGDTDGIRALTIHKSKGLEFHSVIIPFCDWKFESSTHPSTLWVETNPAQYEQMPCLPIVRGKAMKDSDFTDAYREETKQIWMDNLNLLYVAFTRPTANLIVLRRALAASDTPTDVSAFIDKGLAGKMPDNMTICTLHDSKAGGENKLLTQPDTQKVQFHATPIDLEFRQSNASRTFINRGDDTPMSTFIEEGNLLHDIFAHIDTKDDVTAAVQRLYTEGVIDAARKDELERFVRQALQQPVAADWFAGQYILYNECTVLTVTDDGDIIQHRPDRVMCTPDRTIVVDFKFGQRRNDHVDQVRLYMDLLAQMGFKGIEGYLWYVKEQQTIKI